MTPNNYFRHSFEAIGSVFDIQAVGNTAFLKSKIEEFEREMRLFEQKFTRFVTSSEVGLFNSNIGKWQKVSAEFYDILTKAERYRLETDGYFSVGVDGLLSDLGYGYNIGSKYLTDQFLLEFGNDFHVRSNKTIDLGGIGKGMMLDYAKDSFSDFESVFVNAGGDLYVRGLDLDGKKWRVYFENPFNLEEYWGVLEVDGELFLASSNAEKRKWRNGHHLVNPMDGKLADQMAGVFVQGVSGELVDVLSTSLFVMGYEKALNWLKLNPLVEAALIDKNGLMHKTHGFKVNLNLE